MRKELFNFENQDLYRKICGINDEGVKILEKQLETDIIPRGNGFQIEGESAKVEFALDFFKKLEANYRERPDRDFIDSFDFAYILKDAGKELRKKKREKPNRNEVLLGNRATKFSQRTAENIFFRVPEIRKIISDPFRTI